MNMFLIKYREYYTWNGRFKYSVLISYNTYRCDDFKEVRNFRSQMWLMWHKLS